MFIISCLFPHHLGYIRQLINQYDHGCQLRETALSNPTPASPYLSLYCYTGISHVLSFFHLVSLLASISPGNGALFSYLHRILPLREMHLSLPLPLCDTRRVLLAELSPDGTGRLRPEVKGTVFLVLVEESELSALVGIDDCEDSGDRLAKVMAIDFPLSSALCSIHPTIHPSLLVF